MYMCPTYEQHPSLSIHYQKRIIFSRHTVFTNVQVKIHHRRQHILEVNSLVDHVFLKLERSIDHILFYNNIFLMSLVSSLRKANVQIC